MISGLRWYKRHIYFLPLLPVHSDLLVFIQVWRYLSLKCLPHSAMKVNGIVYVVLTLFKNSTETVSPVLWIDHRKHTEPVSLGIIQSIFFNDTFPCEQHKQNSVHLTVLVWRQKSQSPISPQWVIRTMCMAECHWMEEIMCSLVKL